ncbi:MerR family transcriptional regulator [Paenibacillus sp. OV219]|uniref:MerR family transcriptional regulator n=1 Tax=Paenibacillus sp. OV219 TaxID=1884377 RepID=UPI0008B8BADD|nr:MerR family transcriptional regulator [Paenibacillus sp. OV219]SEM76249.1 putative AdoMet-dependent methyltransferase [Paenibacillus sp. OV219]
MKINELAQKLHITPRAIRLYESKGLLSPTRGEENGYRYYSDHDAWRLQTIASLREMGLSLEQIKALMEKLDQGDSASVHHYLELQRMALYEKWTRWKHVIGTLDELIERLETKQTLVLDDLFQLSGDLQHIHESVSTWKDTWEFDRIAPSFDGSPALLSSGSSLSQSEYETVLDFIVQWVAPKQGEEGLDIGTGTGNLAGRLLHGRASMSAIDQSKEMLARCREKYPSIATKLGNALALPFLDKQFSFLVSAFALHHLDAKQQELALAEMNRVLRPNGRICIAGLMYDGLGGGAFEKEGSSGKHPIDRAKLLRWFYEHEYITVQHAVNEWIHVVYAVRKY